MSSSPILVRCSPDQISQAIMKRSRVDKLRFGWNGLFLPGLVKMGSWDQVAIDVREHPTVTLMEGLCKNDFSPEPCLPLLSAYYERRGLSSEHAARKAETKVDEYVDEYRRIAEDMLTHGYRSGIAKDEAGVAIGRSGALLKASGGQHRFALARALGLRSMTVHVRFVHVQWFRSHGQLFRDATRQVITAGLREELGLGE